MMRWTQRFVFCLLLISTGWSQEPKIDLNQATADQLTAMTGISADLAREVVRHRVIFGRFRTIFQLLEVEGMTAKAYRSIRPKVTIDVPLDVDYRIQKLENMYFQLSQFASEGTNDNEADNFIDLALNPNNINQMSYQQLVNLPNVSPIDATRIRQHVSDVGSLKDQRDLRNVENLNYYGYRNVRNFVSYEDGIGQDDKLHGFYTFRIFDTDFIGEEGDVFSNANAFELNEADPYNKYHKVRLTYNDYKAGFSYSKQIGEPEHNDYKFYISASDLKITRDIIVDNLILGNYRVTFGHGVVMENTDFFTPRKNGFGFKKRHQGIIGDISRSRNHDLFGIAAKVRLFDAIEVTGFMSQNTRDAILNEDGSVNIFINLKQRFKEDSVYTTGFAGEPDDPTIEPIVINGVPNMAETVDEFTFGGELKYTFVPGTFLGITFYESWYNRLLRPNVVDLFVPDEQNISERFRNNELIEGVYGGPLTDFDGGDWKSFRRVFGVHGQTVIGDWAFSGEWGMLDTEVARSSTILGGEDFVTTEDTYVPTAFVLSSYIQKSNFNLLVMYRHYDLGFDNPYQHSISNYQRFKGTYIDDDFRLDSPFYTQLYYNADQPQAERGFHFNMRYRASGQLTFISESDIWERVSDGVEQYRIVFRGQYRPLWATRLEVRQKWQSRDADNQNSIDFFYNNETRMNLRVNLSAYDQIELILGRSFTQFPVRPELAFNPDPNGDGYNNIRASIQSSGNVIGFGFRHNFNEQFTLRGQFLAYKGFYWNFEDTQFTVLDALNGGTRFWLAGIARVSNNLQFRLKYTLDEKMNDNNRFIHSEFSDSGVRRYYNTQESGTGNNIYFELVTSF